MEPLVKSMVTIVSPSHYQGRVFSLMSIVSGIGSIISNIIATRMYSNDKILSLKGDIHVLLPKHDFDARAHCCTFLAPKKSKLAKLNTSSSSYNEYNINNMYYNIYIL